MDQKPITKCSAPRFATVARIAVAFSLSFFASSVFAQDQAQPAAQPAPPPPHLYGGDQYVGHFLIYTGGMVLDSPKISLTEPGIHVQAGMRWSRHISLGLDYSRGVGDTSIGLGLATTALQKEIVPLLAELKAAGIIPQNYVAALPLHSVTQTFTAGPEFPIRHWRRVTPYIRPSCGFIVENATAEPMDFLTKTLVNQIAPGGKKDDWTLFYGFGGGMAINFTKHFSIAVQADFVHDHLFPDLLQTGRNTVRFSLGPGVQFGKNVTRNMILH